MDGFMESVIEANSWLNGIVWGVPMIIIIIGAGLWLTAGNGFIQFRHFGFMIKNTLGKIFSGQKTTDKGAVTPFQAVSTALASTVGTGNIAGVAGAIALGGPGAVFWMWMSALVGMATKYSEVVLAIRFRERNAKGDWVGGPMYYILNGLGRNWKWLSILFCIFGAVAAFGIGNIAQVHAMANAISGAAVALSADPGSVNVANINLAVGIIVALLVGLVIFGGIKRIGQAASALVPFMALLYITGTLIVVLSHIGSIGPVLGDIFRGAFGGFRPVAGGVAGFTIAQAMTKGVARGIFSNEAGLGSAPIAHAAADTPGPVNQGLFGIFEVFIDTIVICTLTALTVLMSGTPIGYGSAAGVELTTAGIATTFGNGFASIFMAIAMLCFAGSTVLGWSLYGARCVEFLFGVKSLRVYQVLFLIVLVCGAVMDLGLVWDISDTLNALMAIPNLIGVLALSGVVIKLTKDFFDKRKGQIKEQA